MIHHVQVKRVRPCERKLIKDNRETFTRNQVESAKDFDYTR